MAIVSTRYKVSISPAYRIVWRLEQPEDDVVEPKLPHVVVADLSSPDAEHAVKGDEDAEEVCDLEHAFG